MPIGLAMNKGDIMERTEDNKKEYGALIVEASIVFPVMFLVIFFMIYVGNAYLQKCRIEKIVNEYSIKGAAYCGDPFLQKLSEGDSIVPVDEFNAQPYIMIFNGDLEQIETDIQTALKEELDNVDTGLFSNMKPDVSEPVVNFDSMFIYSTFSIDVDCSVKIPIRLLGQKEYTLFKISNHTEMPVQDVPEFIRNFDMAEDFAESTGLKEKITDVFNKVKKFFKGEK